MISALRTEWTRKCGFGTRILYLWHGYERVFLCAGSYTAQFEHTILLRPTCKEVISRGPDYWIIVLPSPLRHPVVFFDSAYKITIILVRLQSPPPRHTVLVVVRIVMFAPLPPPALLTNFRASNRKDPFFGGAFPTFKLVKRGGGGLRVAWHMAGACRLD